MAQRACWDCERLQRPPRLPRFSPSLTPSCRQRAQIERAKAKRPLIQSDTEEFHGRQMTNMSGNLIRVVPESSSHNREKCQVTRHVQMGKPERCSGNFKTPIHCIGA